MGLLIKKVAHTASIFQALPQEGRGDSLYGPPAPLLGLRLRFRLSDIITRLIA